jgi:DNA-binding beta-propeller fold protein YncE
MRGSQPRARGASRAFCHGLLAALAAAGILVVTAPALRGQQPARTSQQPAGTTQRPGVLGEGVTLLPNGWRIAPAGRHLQAGDFPLSMVATPDRRYLVVTNNGWSKPSLTVIDTEQWLVKAKVPVEHAWLGLAWNVAGTRLYSAGAAENTVHVFDYRGAGAFEETTPMKVAEPALRLPPGTTDMAGTGFIGGIATSADGKTLYAVHVFGRAISAIDLETGRVRLTRPLEAEPYTVLPAPDGRRVYVSLWGGAKVLALDATTFEPVGQVAVGGHPNALALSKDGQRLFVACANTNRVWALDASTLTAREQISVTPFRNAPPGTTPNALAVSPDGETLAVANADNNTVALVDIERPGSSEVEGFVPTGWYPTSVAFDAEGRRLFVLSGKGLTGQANPRGPNVLTPAADGQYIGQLLQGAVSMIDVPDAPALAAHTAKVIAISAYTDAKKLTPAGAPARSPIPRRVGDRSPIQHVFYVIRENRTYDQVLGDLGVGNGDPTLTIFGEEVTPNAHALARQFVLLDNFFVDAEVSYDGHAFSTGAYATDVVEKLWPTNYGRRGGVYLSEGGFGDRNPYGNLSAPSDGYLWDFATRAGVSVRSYGEFAQWAGPAGPDGVRRVQESVPGLKGLVHPTYPPYDLSIPDNQRIDIWLEEFRRYETQGGLPRLNIIRLGNDHTYGTRPGVPTPRSMVAENDRALGRLVEAISRSRFWSTSAIFVLEDDAQNGPDHVDSHRSPAFVISPYTRRGAVDSTLYTTSGMLRTMELILGLPPMSQYDAAATPMYNAFQNRAVLSSYRALPARIPLDERNAANAWGAEASLAMNFDEADMTPEYELNEILWKSVRGAASPMPPPVRAGFLRIIEDEDDEEEREQAGPSPAPAPR